MQLGEEVYIGLDTHRETIFGTALNKKGEVICSYEFPNGKEAFKEFMKSFPSWNTQIALEACSIWRGCYKVLRELGYTVKLANALKCHQIAKDKKTDKVDSKILADLLRVGYLPEVYIPSDDTLKLRDETRHKCNLTRTRVQIQSKIKHFLLREGITYERKIWSEKGINWLKKFNYPSLNDFITIYEKVVELEKAAQRKIGRLVRAKEETSLLNTIPGVGELGAAMIYAEIGTISRFPTVKHLHAYAGVAPGIYQSGTKSRDAKRKEVNRWLKWILGQCVGRAVMMENRFQKYYFKVRKRKGWKTAKKATARKMLSVVWYILKERVPYNES